VEPSAHTVRPGREARVAYRILLRLAGVASLAGQSSMAVSSSGTLYHWGVRSSGAQMNPEDPFYNRRAFPQTPPAGVSLRAVGAGLEQHFVLATGGTIHGRGNHLVGGLGIGSNTNVSGRH
jgi:hypothetical protein